MLFSHKMLIILYIRLQGNATDTFRCSDVSVCIELLPNFDERSLSGQQWSNMLFSHKMLIILKKRLQYDATDTC